MKRFTLGHPATSYTAVVARFITTPRSLSEVLASTWMFESFAEKELDNIAALAVRRTFGARKHIVQKGDPGDGLFVLLRGRAKVTSANLEGGGTAFNIMGAGEVFGEVALLDSGLRSATVTAIDDCETAFIHKDAFRALLLDNPRIGVQLLELLSRRLRQLTERVEDRAFLAVKARLAKQIVRLADDHGGPLDGGGIRIPLAISQQDLGSLVDATRESVNKQLRSWTRSGVLRHDRRQLDVYDMDALRACV